MDLLKYNLQNGQDHEVVECYSGLYEEGAVHTHPPGEVLKVELIKGRRIWRLAVAI